MTALNYVLPVTAQIAGDSNGSFTLQLPQIPRDVVDAVRAGAGKVLQEIVAKSGQVEVVLRSTFDEVMKQLRAANLTNQLTHAAAQLPGPDTVEATRQALNFLLKSRALIRAAKGSNDAYHAIIKEAQRVATQAALLAGVSLAGFVLAGVGCVGLYLQSRGQTKQSANQQKPVVPTWKHTVCKLAIGGGLALAAVATCGVFAKVAEVIAVTAHAGSCSNIHAFENMLAAYQQA